MPILLLGAIALAAGQGDLRDLPGPPYKPAVMPGQREIVLGPQLQRDVTMEVRYENTIPAEFTSSTTFGETLHVYSKGYVRWSITDGSMFDKPCRVFKMDGITKDSLQFNGRRKEYATQNTTTYWITTEGKILRESIRLAEPQGIKTAECVYSDDHIDTSVSDAKGRRTFTVYLTDDLKKLDQQFKPMVEGNKVLLPHKDFFVFDPFTQAFAKYSADAIGPFHGTFLATKFEGLHFDIAGPKSKVKAYISKDGDMIQAILNDHYSLVLNNLPPSPQSNPGALTRIHQ